jgi:hypothetical protein
VQRPPLLHWLRLPLVVSQNMRSLLNDHILIFVSASLVEVFGLTPRSHISSSVERLYWLVPNMSTNVSGPMPRNRVNSVNKGLWGKLS